VIEEGYPVIKELNDLPAGVVGFEVRWRHAVNFREMS
jgi:hypothetical protein